MAGISSGVRGFREGYLATNAREGEDFESWDGRRSRYAILQAYFENTAYRNIHSWSQAYKAQYGLYRYTRSIYNPSHRLGKFYRTRLMGGKLDPAAGDGKAVPSALPIVTDSETIRTAIAALWRASAWQVNKSIFTLHGPVLGDVGLQVIDDPVRERVYLKVLHPDIIKSLTLDEFGNVKGYELEEWRDNPERPEREGQADNDVRYGEIAVRDGGNVKYTTLLNGKPYPWDGEQAEWTVPYGFVPLVMAQHDNVGQDWGWSAAYPNLSKFREADDIASKLSDQVRKMVDAPWLLAGVTNPNASVQTKATVPTTPTEQVKKPEAGRESVPTLYSNDPNAKAVPLVAPLDIAATVTHIQALLDEIEREYPELRADVFAAGGDVAARALRLARQDSTTKVVESRANYDDALVRAQKMAISIGGFRGYEGYEGFALESYAKGDLEHTIGERPVFEVDQVDALEEEKLFWDAAAAAIRNGVSLPLWLKWQGWDQARISEVEASKDYQSRQELLNAGAQINRRGA